MTDYLVPLILLTVSALAIRKKENAYNIMLQGAEDGLKLLVSILPALILLLTAVYMLRASGAMDALSHIFAPILSFLGIPPETVMLVLIRPISGSAALAVGSQLMAQYGVDSKVGLTAAVMLGATETTFYTIAVYSAFLGLKDTRYTLKAALCADLAAFLMSGIAVRLLMG